MRKRMRGTQVLPAAIVGVLLAATWAVPATIAKMVPLPVTTIGADHTEKLEGITGSEVSFEVPAGWSTGPGSDPNAIVYTRAEDSQELSVTVIGDSNDFDVTADRVLREQSVNGTSAAFDGEAARAGGGFSGKSCVAVKPSQQATGPCAVVHHGKTVVVVIGTSTSAKTVPDLQPLLDSLELTKEEETL